MGLNGSDYGSLPLVSSLWVSDPCRVVAIAECVRLYFQCPVSSKQGYDCGDDVGQGAQGVVVEAL